MKHAAWRQDRLNDFWRFVAERHQVFLRRVVQKQPPPWTDDPILQTVAFTNIYRDLDRTTRVLAQSLPPDASLEDLLFNTIKFRFFTWSPTYHALGGFRPVAEWPRVNGKHAGDLLAARQRAGHQVFTGAFMSPSAGAKPGVGGKARLVVKRLGWVRKHLGQLVEVFACQSMEAAHRLLRNVPGFGGFMAYEVLIDLTYTGRTLFDVDGWVYVGPGAFKGLAVLGVRNASQQEAQRLIADLRDRQGDGFRLAGVRMHGPRLTLENVEQALCELQKAKRAQVRGYAKRRFNAVLASTDLSAWHDLSCKYTDPLEWPWA